MLAKLFVKDARLRPFLRVIVFAIAVLVLTSVAYAIYLAVRGRQFSPAMSLSDAIAIEILSAFCVLVVAVVLRQNLDRRSRESLGFALRGRWLRLFSIGVLFGAGMQIVVYALESLSGFAHVIGRGSLTNDARLLAVALVVFFAAAFAEEMAFRGYALQNLWEEWGIAPAVVLTSAAFAAFHLGNPHSREQFALTVAGLVVFAWWACMSLLWTKSLWLALGAHMAWNTFEGPVFGLPVSGVIMPVPTVLVERINGPTWFTGGGFGPEAGVSALVALAAGFAVLRVLYVKGAFVGAPNTFETYATKR